MNRRPTTQHRTIQYRSSLTTSTDMFTDLKGSLPMYSMHEALARDRMRESEQRSAEARLTRSLSASRRWHRLERRARVAAERHSQRASRLATAR